ncbi:MAG: hypothetical protein AAFX93_18620 [Verrucomicrobiota bacterium]
MNTEDSQNPDESKEAAAKQESKDQPKTAKELKALEKEKLTKRRAEELDQRRSASKVATSKAQAVRLQNLCRSNKMVKTVVEKADCIERENAELKEKLKSAELDMSVFQSENGMLKSKIEEIAAENAELKAKLKQSENKTSAPSEKSEGAGKSKGKK